MNVRPGANLIYALAGLLAASLGVFVWGDIVWWLAAAAAALVIAAVVDLRDARGKLACVSLSRAAPGTVGRDRPFVVTWTLRAAYDGPLRGEFRDTLPPECHPNYHVQKFSLDARQFEAVFARELRIPIRGKYLLGPLWIRVSGALGLVECHRRIDTPETLASVRVFPEIYHARETLQQDPRAEEFLRDSRTRSRQSGVGTEFESLRDFRDGDDPRRIDWRTSARMRRTIVRTYQIERHRDVMVLVDCGRLMGADAGGGSKLDFAVDAALMLSRVALRGGDRCGIALFDNQVLGFLAPYGGAPAMQTIADCTYDAHTRWLESDFARMFATLQQRQSKRSLIVVLSDLVDTATTGRFRTSLAQLARRHVVLFAALQTPLLQDIVHEPVDGAEAAARKALSFRLLRERERALHSVRRGGVHVLDVPPSELTVPLLNQFIDLRGRGLV